MAKNFKQPFPKGPQMTDTKPTPQTEQPSSVTTQEEAAPEITPIVSEDNMVSTQQQTDNVLQNVEAIQDQPIIEKNKEAPVKKESVVPLVAKPSFTDTSKTTEDSMFSAKLNEMISNLKNSGCSASSSVIDHVVNYCNVMKPGKQMDADTGARHQVNLYRQLTYMCNTASKDFNLLFATVLKIIDETKETGAFRPSHSCRFTHDMKVDKKDTQAFVNFINLLYVTSTVSGRVHASKQVDLIKSLAHGFTEEGQQKVAAFYNR